MFWGCVENFKAVKINFVYKGRVCIFCFSKNIGGGKRKEGNKKRKMGWKEKWVAMSVCEGWLWVSCRIAVSWYVVVDREYKKKIFIA